MENKKLGSIVIILASALGLLFILSLDPIAQNIEYHNFIDQRTYAGVSNFWNVISNLPFLLVGGMGIYSIYYSQNIKFITEIKIAYTLFYLGVSIIAIGSTYYHLTPSNESLAWDRIPMTIAFMSLFSIIIAEFISPYIGRIILWPLILFGVYSIYYWHNIGDLRLYILVQFLPIIVIPLMLLFFKATFTKTSGYWLLLLAYVVAKVLEHYDSQIYNMFVIVSGHSIKHVIAALGVYLLLNSHNTRAQV